MYPVLMKIGDITIYTYGFTMMTALTIIYILAVRNIHRSVLERDDVDNIGLMIHVYVYVYVSEN